MLKLVVVRLKFIVGHAPILTGAIFGKDAFAVFFGSLAADDEIIRQKTPRVTAPVRRCATDDFARLERAQFPHRQRSLAEVVAKGDGFS